MNRLTQTARGAHVRWFLPAVVLAVAAGSAGCGDSTGPQSAFVAELRLAPDSVHLSPGESADFEARVLDQWGNVLAGRSERVEWSLFNPSVAEMERVGAGASVRALAPGQASLIVELGRGTGSAPIYVQPPGLARIEIEPSPVNLSVGTSLLTRVRLLDADGDELDPTGFRISWTTTDSTVARTPAPLQPQPVTRVFGMGEGQVRLSAIVGRKVVRTDVFVILEPVRPAAPEIHPLSPTALELVWPLVLGANDGYRLDRARTSGGPYAQVAAPGQGAAFASFDTTFTDASLSPGTTYYYRLRACNLHGCSEPSEVSSGTTESEGFDR